MEGEDGRSYSRRSRAYGGGVRYASYSEVSFSVTGAGLPEDVGVLGRRVGGHSPGHPPSPPLTVPYLRLVLYATEVSTGATSTPSALEFPSLTPRSRPRSRPFLPPEFPSPVPTPTQSKSREPKTKTWGSPGPDPFQPLPSTWSCTTSGS